MWINPSSAVRNGTLVATPAVVSWMNNNVCLAFNARFGQVLSVIVVQNQLSIQSAQGEQSAEDYCNICWVESLGSAPSIKLKCGHVFHFTCVKSKVKKRWPAARITFGFSECPLCKNPIGMPFSKMYLNYLFIFHRTSSPRRRAQAYQGAQGGGATESITEARV